MIELNLQRTWYEISDYLNSNDSNPLRIAELINRVPQCSWTFKFRFDRANRINLRIDCDLEISDDCARELLDGSLYELLFAETVYLRQAGKYFAANTSKFLEDSLSSDLLTLKNTDKEADSLLSLHGFCLSDSLPREIQSNSFSFVRRHFLENTWLGSLNCTDSGYEIVWDVFKEVESIQPANRYEDKLSSADGFTAQEALHNSNGDYIGKASFQTSPLLENDEIYTRFGPLVPQPRDWLSRRRNDPHWIVEIDSQELCQAMLRRTPARRLINELVDSVNSALDKVVIDSGCFGDYKRKLRRKQQIIAANRLKQRQERAESAPRVIFEGEPVMLVPENENEVLALLCKLESLRALPFHEFLLLEYTAKVGIDAIGTYQIRETDNRPLYATIEVEHLYENFFDHDHPHSQVELLICWDFLAGEPPTELHPLSDNGYLFEYRNDHSFKVFVLSHIPNLQFNRSLNNVQ